MDPIADDIFAKARELETAAREIYLTQACGEDAELRLEVQRMLVDSERADSFFGGDDSLQAEIDARLAAHRADGYRDDATLDPEVEEVLANLKAEEEGEQIGRYKLLQEIGEGGFGSVWMAEQTKPVTRRVALKVIKLGMDTRDVVARFEAERQALAMMDHPHIAKVLDAGATDRGRPYFVMELVKGIPITDYCDEASLGTDERLALFKDVCSAIQHAHQKGIIHRDIKPSNVMVTLHGDKPVVKVIDFGIAKATQGKLTDKTLFTRFEQFIGTPVYMSPEQAVMSGLDIDTRSDIYALGILLYELLTGKPPFDPKTLVSAGYDEMRRIIREVEPPKPSSRLGTVAGEERTALAKAHRIAPDKLSRLVASDLDWIVMKAIDKDRARRYETANGLAADIGRFLADEAVDATPPSAGYKLRKFARRNKAAFRVGAAIAVVLIAATLTSTWQAIRATKAEERANAEAQRASAALDELRTTAPAFASQARTLAAMEKFGEAIEKLNYAIKLRPDATEYLIAKADLLQCQLKLAEAAVVYREALALTPDLASAEESAKLCDELLAADSGARDKLSHESLAKLFLVMQGQQRPAAELMPVARLLGEENKLVVDYWLERLKDLPIPPEKPLQERLQLAPNGRLTLDLSQTKVSDLEPLRGMPVEWLSLKDSDQLTNLAPLEGTPLRTLHLEGLSSLDDDGIAALSTLTHLKTLTLDRTEVSDLSPLREMHTLEKLDISGSKVTDLSPLAALQLNSFSFQDCEVRDLTPIREMSLEELNLRGTRVADLSPLIGMPIKSLNLSDAPVKDFSPLAQLPLEKCYLERNRITDLSVLGDLPLKELTLWGCMNAHNYRAITKIKSLELLLLPSNYHSLWDQDYAAIASLRSHPNLRQLGSEFMVGMSYAAIGPKDLFWKNWDVEQTFVPALRKKGLKFALTKFPDGTYMLYMDNQPLSDLSILNGAPISHLFLNGGRVSDLAPVRDLPHLKFLGVARNPVTDLNPLAGLPLISLGLNGTPVSDLSPLKGMQLKSLWLHGCENITDVALLAEMPTLERVSLPPGSRNIESLRTLPNLRILAYTSAKDMDWAPSTTAEGFWRDFPEHSWLTSLRDMGVEVSRLVHLPNGTWSINLDGLPISDLSILQGARISRLSLSKTRTSDLTPLQGMPLTSLRLDACTEIEDVSALARLVTLKQLSLPPGATNVESLQSLPALNYLSYDWDKKGNRPVQQAAEFWQKYKQHGWLRALREAGISPRDAEQLPDGTWNLNLAKSAITDLEPLRGIELKSLKIGGTKITDLSPLEGMQLKELDLNGCPVIDLSVLRGMPLEKLNLKLTGVSDISVLRGMPLIGLKLRGCKKLTDLSPLAESKELTSLTLPPDAGDIEFLRDFPKLKLLSFEIVQGSWVPAHTAEQFWKAYDSQASGAP